MLREWKEGRPQGSRRSSSKLHRPFNKRKSNLFHDQRSQQLHRRPESGRRWDSLRWLHHCNRRSRNEWPRFNRCTCSAGFAVQSRSCEGSWKCTSPFPPPSVSTRPKLTKPEPRSSKPRLEHRLNVRHLPNRPHATHHDWPTRLHTRRISNECSALVLPFPCMRSEFRC